MQLYGVLDEALEAIHDAGPELRSGPSNHAPMAIEALCAMNRADAVAGWFEHYRSGMIPRPPAIERIPRDDWRPALARPERFTDWSELIAEELREARWPVVIDRWVTRLAPGISAAATHGVIRTAHAARALGQSATSTRLAELADGLAYWASTYATLPTREMPNPSALDPREAITRVAIVPPAKRIFAGSITSSFVALDQTPDFATAINLLGSENDPARALSRLTETFARVYLTNAHDALSTIVFIHGVTSAAAVRSLLPHLSQRAAQAALRYVWQTGCALYATFAVTAPRTFVADADDDSAETLIEMAVVNGDEHVIKFTEACLREDAISPSPVYRAAARHAMTMLKA
jgi:hypothetical protein